MNFLSDESPSSVIPIAGAVLMSMSLLYTVTTTGLDVKGLAQVFVPAQQSGVAIKAALQDTVYAVAVYVGAIPFEHSAYYAVDLPMHHVGSQSRVAGATEINIDQEALETSVEASLEIEVAQYPWQGLYKLFRGK